MATSLPSTSRANSDETKPDSSLIGHPVNHIRNGSTIPNLQALDQAEQALADVQSLLGGIKTALESNSSSVAACFADPHLQARREVRKRRKRNETFGEALFSDPAWDMLLILYSEMPAREELSVRELSVKAEVPLTTALRWISVLETKAFIFRRDHDADRRVVNIGLTDKGLKSMAKHFAD